MQRVGKINCNDNFEKIHHSKIKNFITVDAMIFFQILRRRDDILLQKNKIRIFFLYRSHHRFRENSDE